MMNNYLRAMATAFAMLLCVSLQAGAQDATTLRVQILNGRTGRPVTNVHLKLFRDSHLHAFSGGHDDKGETTDGEGYAPIPNIDATVGNAFIAVDLHRACSKTDKHDFSLAKVRVAGVVSENSCKPRISMYPQPGTLIFYVRDLTLLEKMRR
jgi:hypothetical protein